jgi:hypothetical protein
MLIFQAKKIKVKSFDTDGSYNIEFIARMMLVRKD